MSVSDADWLGPMVALVFGVPTVHNILAVEFAQKVLFLSSLTNLNVCFRIVFKE